MSKIWGKTSYIEKKYKRLKKVRLTGLKKIWNEIFISIRREVGCDTDGKRFLKY